MNEPLSSLHILYASEHAAQCFERAPNVCPGVNPKPITNRITFRNCYIQLTIA